jgi:dTDP-glucose pyrophosphorylase
MIYDNFSKISVTIKSSIRDAINIINTFPEERTALIVDGIILIGLVTEGDIRRALLAGYSIDDPVLQITNKAPTLFRPDITLLSREVYPVLEGKTLKGYFFKALTSGMENFSALIMAGGFGTRLMPLTQDIPKPMIHVNKKPILERIIEGFIKHGIKKFYISTHYLPESITEYFGDGSDLGIKIEYLHESSPLGTGGCLTLLKNSCDNLIVANGDILTNLNYSQLVDHHVDSSKDVTICVRNYEQQVPFGVVYGSDSVTSIVEKPRNQFLINSGIYIINKTILEKIILNTPPFDMPDVINKLINQGEKIGMYHLKDFWIDIGDPHELKKAENVYVD